MKKFWVIVTAAGSSRRMGGGNKLLLPVAGRPVLIHTLDYFERQAMVDGLIVSSPPDQLELYQGLLQQFALRKVIGVVAGGAERQESIRLALEALPAQAADWVAIHDGARPCLEENLLERLRQALGPAQGSLPMVAVKDTIKQLDEQGRVSQTLVRSQLFAAQTPQLFHYGLILEAHRWAQAQNYLGTDDCSLVEARGGVIQSVAGDYRNIKLTTPEDLQTLANFLGER